MGRPIGHTPQRALYEHHRFSMTNNYPFAFGDSPYQARSSTRDAYEQSVTQPPQQPTATTSGGAHHHHLHHHHQNSGTPRSGDQTSNDNPYVTLTPESNHDEQSSDHQWKQSSPGSNDMNNTTFSPGLNNPNQQINSPNNNVCTMYTTDTTPNNNIPQPRFSEMVNTATTKFYN